MNTKQQTTNIPIPDIASEAGKHIDTSINHVGMSALQCPIFFTRNSQKWETVSTCDINVNLRRNTSRGIHMSRLYETLITHTETMPLSTQSLSTLLEKLLQSHSKESDSAHVSFSFLYKYRQHALQSNLHGYRYYPITLKASKTPQSTTFSLSFTITYSSTCPCSAALSRHAIQETFIANHPTQRSFSKDDIINWLGKESSISATPHAQRSEAVITLTFDDSFELNLETLISSAEAQIQTAVQSAVKRIDEKAFAQQNAAQLLFCEDAVRIFATWLDSVFNLQDYQVTATHHESLHPHNATASITKNYKNNT